MTETMPSEWTDPAVLPAAEFGACHVDNPSDHPVAADPGVYSGDRLHLNARGHAFAAANTVRALAAHLASA
ncbi:hypothetical protein [Actinomadura formosensis]|uniref:hypothetical protein n=1 Tax=Actinomadura formosensis TaxID=60706 RepID=UPI003D90CC9A